MSDHCAGKYDTRMNVMRVGTKKLFASKIADSRSLLYAKTRIVFTSIQVLVRI